jgi:hypothetical protein
MTNETTKTIQTTIYGNSLTIKMSDGKEVTVHAHDMKPEIREFAMMHGFKQKIVDAAALSRNPDTGRSATVEDKFHAMMTVIQQLSAGDWNKRAGDGSATAGGLLVRALCKLYPLKTLSDIRAFLDGKTKSEQAALRKNPKVATIIDTLREEDVADGIDTDTMLDTLE